MRFDNCSIFLFSPLIFLYVGIEVIVPPFSALLANSAWKCLRDVAPIFGPKFHHIFRELFILFLTPRSFDHRRIQNLLPAVQALHVGPLVQVGSDLLPVFGSELPHKFSQIEVLLGVPVPFCILWLLSAAIILIRLKCTIGVLPI